jgi:hypothetical protein
VVAVVVLERKDLPQLRPQAAKAEVEELAKLQDQEYITLAEVAEDHTVLEHLPLFQAVMVAAAEEVAELQVGFQEQPIPEAVAVAEATITLLQAQAVQE